MLDATDALLDEIDAVLEVELDDSHALTLADLIRNGSKLAPQAIGAWRGQEGETCALSAAYDAAKKLDLL